MPRNFNKVPLLLGANENGGSIFEPMLPMVLPGARLPVKRYPETLNKALRYFFQENISKVEAIYTKKNLEMVTCSSDGWSGIWFLCVLWEL